MLNNHWYILGAGAIGTLLSCMFQKANIQSTLLVRTQLADHPNLTLVELDGSHQMIDLPTQAINESSLPITQLVLTTKAHQSHQAMIDIQSRLCEGAIIIVMQNGMGVIETLTAKFPQYRIIAASTTEGANRPTDNYLIHAGSGETWIGPFSINAPLPMLALAQQIAGQWQALPMKVRYDPQINHRLWTKLAINCAINPLTVKYQCRNGELLQNPHALSIMEDVCEELQCLMTAKQIPHNNDLFQIAKQVALNTRTNISSMLQDHKNGRPTEIDYINGYVVSNGEALGISIEHNRQLVNTVRQDYKPLLG
ncbi:hypothetical protein A9Q99_03425 [Gammaproteobacteria bacterium 45_16_T64]|nr:hypothetical protein A9Q99_03425 [Gammaproteobacteria bacterium 45_16_T64]